MVHGVFEERPDHIVGGIDELDAKISSGESAARSSASDVPARNTCQASTTSQFRDASRRDG